MSTGRAIATHTILQSVGKFGGLALSLVAAGLLFPYLGEAGVGKYTAIISLLQVFGILMDLGLYIILIKKIATWDELTPRLASHIVTMRAAAGVLCLSLAPLTAWIIGRSNPLYDTEFIWGIVIVSVFSFSVSMNQLLSAIFQKWFATQWIVLSELIGKTTIVIATFAVVSAQSSFLWAMSSISIGAFVNLVIMLLASRRYVRLWPAFDWPVWKGLLIEAWPLGLSIAFALLYFKGDAVILSFYTDPATVGQYGAPYKILEVLANFPAILSGLLLPLMTNAWQQRDMGRLHDLIQRSFNLLLMVALPMIVTTWVVSQYMIDVLVNTGFEQSAGIMNILILAVGCMAIATLFGYLVPAVDRQRSMLVGYMVVAVTALAGYLIFIPRYSIQGAAWVTVYSEAAVMLISVALVLRTTHTRLNGQTALRVVLASAALYGVLAWGVPVLADQLLNGQWTGGLSPRWLGALILGVVAPVASLCYGVCLLLLRVITPQEIKTLLLRQPTVAP